MSLNNYAVRLIEMGRDKDVINYTEQALVIYQRLAQKIPARYELDYYETSCNTLFLHWLSNEMLIS